MIGSTPARAKTPCFNVCIRSRFSASRYLLRTRPTSSSLVLAKRCAFSICCDFRSDSCRSLFASRSSFCAFNLRAFISPACALRSSLICFCKSIRCRFIATTSFLRRSMCCSFREDILVKFFSSDCFSLRAAMRESLSSRACFMAETLSDCCWLSTPPLLSLSKRSSSLQRSSRSFFLSRTEDSICRSLFS